MGPGGFHSPTGTGAVGDRIRAWDREVGRLSFFGRDGRPRSSLRLGPGEVAFVLEGGIVVRRPRIAGRQTTFDVAFERVREGDGAVIDTVAALRYDRPVLRIQRGPITSSFAQPFTDIPFTFLVAGLRPGYPFARRRGVAGIPPHRGGGLLQLDGGSSRSDLDLPRRAPRRLVPARRRRQSGRGHRRRPSGDPSGGHHGSHPLPAGPGPGSGTGAETGPAEGGGSGVRRRGCPCRLGGLPSGPWSGSLPHLAAFRFARRWAAAPGRPNRRLRRSPLTP